MWEFVKKIGHKLEYFLMLGDPGSMKVYQKHLVKNSFKKIIAQHCPSRIYKPH